MCRSDTRDCREQDDNDNLSINSQICQHREREDDKSRLDIAARQNIIPMKENHQKCTRCSKEKAKDQFIGERDVVTKNCKSCRHIGKRNDQKRDRAHVNEKARDAWKEKPGRKSTRKAWNEKNRLHLSFEEYKRSARKEKIAFKITRQEFSDIVENACQLCGIIDSLKGFHGIFLHDRDKGYVSGNCVSCCTMCNRMKGCLPATVFIKRVEHILLHLKKIEKGSYCPELFADHKGGSFSDY